MKNNFNLLSCVVFFIFCFSILSTANAQLEWYQKGENINGEADSDNSGWSISTSADGSIVAIGARGNEGSGLDIAGHVRVYQYSTDAWVQMGQDIDGESDGDESGISVSLSDDGLTVAIGAYSNSDSAPYAGQVRIFHFDGTSWVQVGSDIDGDADSDRFGYSVSISSNGEVVAMGAPYHSGYHGQVKAYAFSGGDWLQLGSDIDGEGANDICGNAVSLSSDGTILAVGAMWNDGNGSDSGHVRVYEFSGTEWEQIGSDIDGEEAGDNCGYSVSLNNNGTILAIGESVSHGDGVNRGQTRVFEYVSDNWVQKGQDLNGDVDNCFFGNSVSISADGLTMAVGLDYYTGTLINAGQVRVYKFQENAWLQSGSSIDGENANDLSGFSVSLSSDATVLAIGATNNPGGGFDRGNVRVFYSCSQNSVIDTQSACDNFVWIDGITYTENNNTASFTLTNQGGCDSIVNLDLTINTLDISVSFNESTISAVENGANYQWVDCNDEYAWLAAEVSQDFTPVSNGSYAVILEQGACVDTSECVTVTRINKSNLNLEEIRMYPNPVVDELIIETTEGNIANYFEILNASGQIVSSGTLENRKTVNTSLLSSGLYFIRIINLDNIYYLKFVKT